jgi:hypothetical protein
MDFLAHEFTRLRGWGLALALVAAGALQRCAFWHRYTLRQFPMHDVCPGSEWPVANSQPVSDAIDPGYEPPPQLLEILRCQPMGG